MRTGGAQGGHPSPAGTRPPPSLSAETLPRRVSPEGGGGAGGTLHLAPWPSCHFRTPDRRSLGTGGPCIRLTCNF